MVFSSHAAAASAAPSCSRSPSIGISRGSTSKKLANLSQQICTLMPYHRSSRRPRGTGRREERESDEAFPIAGVLLLDRDDLKRLKKASAVHRRAAGAWRQ